MFASHTSYELNRPNNRSGFAGSSRRPCVNKVAAPNESPCACVRAACVNSLRASSRLRFCSCCIVDSSCSISLVSPLSRWRASSILSVSFSSLDARRSRQLNSAQGYERLIDEREKVVEHRKL